MSAEVPLDRDKAKPDCDSERNKRVAGSGEGVDGRVGIRKGVTEQVQQGGDLKLLGVDKC